MEYAVCLDFFLFWKLIFLTLQGELKKKLKLPLMKKFPAKRKYDVWLYKLTIKQKMLTSKSI